MREYIIYSLKNEEIKLLKIQGINGRIIFKRIPRRHGMRVPTEFTWFRLGSRSGLLWILVIKLRIP
jgi:hypothetical protein